MMSVKNRRPAKNIKIWEKSVLSIIKSLKGGHRNLPKQ